MPAADTKSINLNAILRTICLVIGGTKTLWDQGVRKRVCGRMPPASEFIVREAAKTTRQNTHVDFHECFTAMAILQRTYEIGLSNHRRLMNEHFLLEASICQRKYK